MLHKDASIVAPATFNLIIDLQRMQEFKEFHLVGGTSLALQLGHRNSIDIDLFTRKDFDDTEIANLVSSKHTFKEIFRRKHTIICLLNNIKTDFIKHDFPLIRPPIEEDGIRLLSKEDIAAMKFHAIIQSGKRLKDFIDVYFLLEHFSMDEMMGFFVAKYSYSNPVIAMKAVNFFGDVDENIDSPQLVKPASLKQIKERIQQATLHPKNIFRK